MVRAGIHKASGIAVAIKVSHFDFSECAADNQLV